MEREIKQKIKKYPYSGYSQNLIESFLIIGFENSFKKENSKEISVTIQDIVDSISKAAHPLSGTQDFSDPYKLNIIPLKTKPVILNNISSNFTDGMLNEEEIINYCFPNKDTPVYACNVKNEMQPLNQNLIFYLSAEKIIKEISQDNDPIDKEDKKLNSHIMFHVFGYLFWECYYSENFKIFFPKIFVFISQYPYFQFFSYLSQNIIYRIKNAISSITSIG